ncbi:MAG: NAD-dependent DNA ligase LigA [Clostridiaceae bacterium]
MTERMRELVTMLNEYANAYHVLDAPMVSDAEYDRLFDELLALEAASGTVLPDSPTLRVGGEPLSAFQPHRHLKRLLSFDKVRTAEELFDWANRAERLRAEHIAKTGEALPPLSFALEYKFDGLTVNLTYENGALINAATRGNGEVGEEILPQVKTIRSLPLSIPFKGRMEVRGECYMKLSVLEQLNKTSQEPLKNARNAAAGALRNLDPQVTAKRRLDCFCYDVGYIEGKTLADHFEMLGFLKENGFPVSGGAWRYESIDALQKGVEDAEKARETLDFLIDGMVVKVCDFKTREALGATDRFPRWAIAYKFAAEETTTVVREVTWEVGRTGKLTPRARFDPVELAGATIRHATLNNYDDIKRKRVGLGSTVFLRRSNDVIPEILGAVEGDVPEHEIEMPRTCPACGAHVEQRGVHIFCTNSLSCRPQIAGRLTQYASRNAMDIETFSEKTADLFVERLNLNSIPDLYDLTENDFLALEGFQEKKAKKLKDAIDRSKDCALNAFLFAIGIPNVGEKTARDLARSFHTFEAVRAAARDELLSVRDIGPIVADSILEFFSDPSIASQIDRLLAHGVRPRPEENTTPESSPLAGKTLVVTGSMERMDRQEIEALIESLGGKAASSVSKNTDFVVAGPGAGSKLSKALELNVTVLDESEFFNMIGEAQ